jgi:drug/metabolite transporter (DMT)-like permease
MWQWSALIAMSCFAGYQLILRELSRTVAPSILLLLVFAFGTTFYLGHVLVARVPIVASGPAVGWLVLVALLSYVGNFHQLRAVTTAPNPGYAIAIVGLQAVVLMLVSFVFLGAALSWTKAAGVFLCCAGVALLVM